MGCTSSAQNMAPSLANSNSDTDQNILEGTDENQIEPEKGHVHEKNHESNGIKVLPRCDNLDEPKNLDSLSKLVDTAMPDFGKDSHANGHVNESENENTDIKHLSADTSESEDRLSHLEEVVEKVVELYENGGLEIPTELEQISNVESQTKTLQGGKDNNNKEQKEDDNEANDTEDAEEEVASPSQSQSSRATRWEALADIAAELPPSLAVDPTTGQIYALSK